jgi:hypothetical protein
MIGDYWAEGNESLANLAGLNSLTAIGGGLMVAFNYLLTDMAGLENLTSIGGELAVFYNPHLVSLSGLENVADSSISKIIITGNPLLTECNIQGICGHLADLHNVIDIYNNGPGCDNPHEIADNCGFNLSCLPYGNYHFISQANVDSFPSYYPDCHNLEGEIWIEGEDIVGLDSLIGIDTISGSVYICGNPQLSSLDGLNNLRTIQGYFHLGYWEHGSNPLLINMTGLDRLSNIDGSVLILGNSSLRNFQGLDSLTVIGSNMEIIENESLENLAGLNALNSISSIKIAGNDSILSLDGLQGLVNIASSFEVSYNPLLTSLNGIENIDADSLMFLRVRYNDSLSECNVKSVCDFLGIPDANVIIEDNAPGCNTPLEVEDACSVGIGESAACLEGEARRISSRQLAVVCYPNPAHDHVFFDINLQTQSAVNLSVFNNMGQMVATILDGSLEKGDHQLSWNVSGVPPGIYYYRFRNGNYSFTGKLLKLKSE